MEPRIQCVKTAYGVRTTFWTMGEVLFPGRGEIVLGGFDDRAPVYEVRWR